MSQALEPFGKYVLLEKLATGGMAEVYLARNPGIGISKFVAIKRILPQFSENENFIEMFKGEAKIAINLAHSNIVSIQEFGVEKEQFFIVMDYVEGRNLRQLLNKLKKNGGSFSIEQTVYIIKEVAAGLDHAHRCLDGSTGKPLNIIHRDMSPQNVMVSFEGEVKVVDFGIAKAETQLETTRAGELKGKFGYMSPEQAEGQPVDLRTDIFSLGIVLWEMLANDRLFIANNEINTLRKIRECQVPSLRKINPNIPQELERICSMSLAKDRNLRYQTAATFHRELSRFMNRQYPDFSPHDFSVFIKTLFANEILESRKRQIEYASLDIKPPQALIAAPAIAVAEAAAPPALENSVHTSTPMDLVDGSPANAGSLPSVPSFISVSSQPSGDFANNGRDQESRRQRAEAEARAKAKAEADAKAKIEAEARAKAADADDDRRARAARAKSEAVAAEAKSREKPAPPRVNSARESARTAKAEDFSLAVDTGNGWNQGSIRDKTFSGQTHVNYTFSGRYSPAMMKRRKGENVVMPSAAIALILCAVALGGAGLYLRERQEISERARPLMTAVSSLLTKQGVSPGGEPRVPSETSEQASVSRHNIKVVSEPVSGAQILVDGAAAPVETTPADFHLPAGRHTISVELPLYKTFRNVVDLREDQPLQVVTAKMAPERQGALNVDTDFLADITVDGRKIGTATMAVRNEAVVADRDLLVRATLKDHPNLVAESHVSVHEHGTVEVKFKRRDFRSP